jgi:hypothetical protein
MRGDLAVLAIVAITAEAVGQSCDLVPSFDLGRSPTRTVYVSPLGSNATGNGTAGSPYGTIAFAAAQATPGTAVVLLPGTYPGGTFLANLAGTAAAPIWIGGAPGQARPVIEGGGEGLHLVKPRYVVVHDLEVRNVSANGINADDGGDYANAEAARFLTLRRVHVRDVGGTGNQDGIKLSGVRDVVVVDCEIERCGGANAGSGVDMVGCHRGLIARTTFRDMSGNAVQCKGGSDDVEVRWCRMIEAGQRAVNMGGSTGFEFFRPPLSTTEANFEARDIRVVSNLFVGSQAPVAFVGCVDCLAANNTIITPHNWILRILQETVTQPPYTFIPCSGGRFVNNLVYFERADLSTYVNIGGNTAPATFAFDGNLWYAFDNPGASAPTLPVVQTNGVVGLDPLFFDPQGNFSLRPSSPARGRATSPLAAGGDLAGVCYALPASIGAFEVCRANCDGSSTPPVLTANDFQCFLNQFSASSPEANCDGSSSPPILTANDFQCFLNAFAAGCP